jgi:glycosyltransferase involved in cell wall biosynthesis
MRILHIANHFLPRKGGVELSVACTAEAQCARGHDVAVLTETPSGAHDDTALPYSVWRFSVPIVRPFTRFLYWHWMFRHRKWLHSVDVLHFHDYSTFINWFLPVRFLLHSPLYAVTFHGFEQWPIRWKHRLLRHVTATLTDVRFAVGSYLGVYYGHAVDAVYYGAAVRQTAAVPRGNEAVFAWIGRLSEDTGIHKFARDLQAACAASGIRAILRVGGEGILRDAIEALADERLRIHCVGAVDNPASVYDGARYVVASGYLSIFEAFQSGIPVLVPCYTELKKKYVRCLEGIEDMAILLESSAQAAETLCMLLNGRQDEVEASMTSRAMHFAAERSWQDVAGILDVEYLQGFTRAGKRSRAHESSFQTERSNG